MKLTQEEFAPLVDKKKRSYIDYEKDLNTLSVAELVDLCHVAKIKPEDVYPILGTLDVRTDLFKSVQTLIDTNKISARTVEMFFKIILKSFESDINYSKTLSDFVDNINNYEQTGEHLHFKNEEPIVRNCYYALKLFENEISQVNLVQTFFDQLLVLSQQNRSPQKCLAEAYRLLTENYFTKISF